RRSAPAAQPRPLRHRRGHAAIREVGYPARTPGEEAHCQDTTSPEERGRSAQGLRGLRQASHRPSRATPVQRRDQEPHIRFCQPHLCGQAGQQALRPGANRSCSTQVPDGTHREAQGPDPGCPRLRGRRARRRGPGPSGSGRPSFAQCGSTATPTSSAWQSTDSDTSTARHAAKRNQPAAGISAASRGGMHTGRPWSPPARHGRGPGTASSTSDPADADYHAGHFPSPASFQPASADPASAPGHAGEVQVGHGPSLHGGERERQGRQRSGVYPRGGGSPHGSRSEGSSAYNGEPCSAAPSPGASAPASPTPWRARPPPSPARADPRHCGSKGRWDGPSDPRDGGLQGPSDDQGAARPTGGSKENGTEPGGGHRAVVSDPAGRTDPASRLATNHKLTAAGVGQSCAGRHGRFLPEAARTPGAGGSSQNTMPNLSAQSSPAPQLAYRALRANSSAESQLATRAGSPRAATSGTISHRGRGSQPDAFTVGAYAGTQPSLCHSSGVFTHSAIPPGSLRARFPLRSDSASIADSTRDPGCSTGASSTNNARAPPDSGSQPHIASRPSVRPERARLGAAGAATKEVGVRTRHHEGRHL
ncbi:unnamed protein product, partial [Prorocentrum cordatum]